jgi:pimeloyl-ACP methyl ester carboxylesterase
MCERDKNRRLALTWRGVCLAVTYTLVAVVGGGCGEDESLVFVKAPITETTISVPGGIPPANPSTGTATPPDLNRSYAEAYQLASVTDQEVTRVVILVPGFQGGAGDFRYLAQRLIERTNGRTVVWAVDRRSNALEDQTGLDAAEAGRDPDIAKDYYFHQMSIDGKTFAGFLDSSANSTDISFTSEWGLKTHIEDIDALITEADRRYPGVPIFLGGHSLGGSIVPIYAAWDFGGRAGFERLSGLILLEGTPQPAAAGAIPDQTEYETTGFSGAIGEATSLQSLRTGDPLSSIPFVGRDLFVTSEILGMRASQRLGQPTALNPDADVNKDFSWLLFGFTPKATNRAALAFGYDKHFEPLAFTCVSLGEAVGPVGPNPHAALFASVLGFDESGLLAPSDPRTTYDWQPSSPDHPAPTDLDTFAEALFAGPSDFIEWYFPAGLTLDVGIVNGMNVQASGDWRNDVYGLAVTENGRVDVPVFAVAGGDGLVVDAANFGPYRDSISPTLRNGSARSATPAGFEAFTEPGYAHLDVLTAADSGAADSEFGRLVSWMDAAVGLAPPPR